MNVIETRELTKRYRGTTAIDSISFSVEQGQVFGFVGPNGGGKTTTIGMLLGIITPTSGTVSLFGLTGREGLHQARQRVGATLETPNFYPHLTGLENLQIVANLKGVDRRQTEATLDVVGLLARRDSRFRTYSLGMKQRLAIAATLLGDPELVILDEPANGLDPEGIGEIRDVILELRARGKTVFVSSHLLNEIERTCTHVAILQKGRIIRQSSIHNLIGVGTTVAIRGGDLEQLRHATSEYPGAENVSIVDDSVIVTLDDADPAALNRFLAGRGIYLSHLASQHRSLEDAFLGVTRDRGAPGGGAVTS